MTESFGGGIVPGSLVLVGGDPGIGKSTLFASDEQMSVRTELSDSLCVRRGITAADQAACRSSRGV